MTGHDRQTPSVNCRLAPIETWRLRPKPPEKSQNIENSQKQMSEQKTNKQKYFHDSRQVRKKVC